MSDGTTLTGTESGDWLDGAVSWFGSFATSYSEAWIDSQFPEQSEPQNPDNVVDPAAAATQQGSGLNIDNKTLLIGVGLIAVVMLIR